MTAMSSALALSLCAFGLVFAAGQPVSAAEPAALDFKMNSLSGEEVDLSKYKGKVVLVVNVASKCGLTPQYKGLQELYDKHKDDGLVILGFPCNEFRNQEPGTSEEIREFCTEKYGVTFDMFEKINVNGDAAAPLYKYLTSLEKENVKPGPISWNFEKFLINRDGEVVARFNPRTPPSNKEFVAAIEKELAAKK